MAKRKRLHNLPEDADEPIMPITDVTPGLTLSVLREADGSEPFTTWLNSLRDREAKQRVLSRLTIVQRGSLGVARFVGEGVSELKIDYGPGYRLYFGRQGDTFVILIIGGDKSTQQADIVHAIDLWKRYKDGIKDV